MQEKTRDDKIHYRYSLKNLCNNWFIFAQIARYNKRLKCSRWKAMKIENIQNSITKLLSCLYSYFLTMSISQLVSFFISKTILTYTGSELENKRINCEKTGFRAIHTENDADMFLSWRRIINDATEFSTR